MVHRIHRHILILCKIAKRSYPQVTQLVSSNSLSLNFSKWTLFNYFPNFFLRWMFRNWVQRDHSTRTTFFCNSKFIFCFDQLGNTQNSKLSFSSIISNSRLVHARTVRMALFKQIVLVETFTGGFWICTELAMMQLVSIDVHQRHNVWAEPFGVVKGG